MKKKPDASFFKVDAENFDSSLLVEIVLWEKQEDIAWKEALAGGCNSKLWMALAGLRAKEHPAEATVVYETWILPELLSHTGDEAYRETTFALLSLEDCMTHTGRHDEFKSYCSSLRLTYKARRNFIRAMDKAGLS